MTKIEEIIDHYEWQFIETLPHNMETCFVKEDVIEAMKLYAEYYAKKCLEIAVDAAKIQINTGTKIYYLRSFDNREFPEHESFIDRKSITNIQLPEHD